SSQTAGPFPFLALLGGRGGTVSDRRASTCASIKVSLVHWHLPLWPGPLEASLVTLRLLGDAVALWCAGGVFGDTEASPLIPGSIRHPRDRSAHLQLHTGYRRFRCPAHRLPRTESGVHGRMPPLFPRELHIRNASHHRPPQDPLPALFRDDESDLALFRDDK